MKHLVRASLFLLLTLLAAAPAWAQRANTSLNMPLLGRWQDPDPSVFYNDIWAYVAPDGREYAIVGSSTGTNFVEVTNPFAPRFVQWVPGRVRQDATWRDYKTYSHYAYGVADGWSGNSLQVFDLQYLPDSVHTVYDRDTLSVSAHTCFIEGDRLYLVNNKRFWTGSPYADVDILSLADPEKPRYLQTINLPQNIQNTGGHAMFARNDTLFVSGGFGGMFVYDARNPLLPRLLNRFADQSGNIYNHTSWTTSNGKLLVMEEEVPNGRPLQLFDLTNFQSPQLVSSFNSHPLATPHNPFIIDDRYVVSSWYHDGVQVYDITNPATPVRMGYYDTYPDNDSSMVVGSEQGYDGYHGCWGVYPFLPSRNIIASDITYGLFVLRPPYLIAGQAEVATPTAVQVWPNPTTERVRLRLDRPATRLSVEVLNAVGQRALALQQLTAPSGEASLSVADLSAGIYFLRIQADGQTAVVRRLVKQ